MPTHPMPHHHWLPVPRRAWYPGDNHFWRYSGPQNEVAPPRDEVDFHNAFRPVPRDGAGAVVLQGVRDFRDELQRVQELLDELKGRFETRVKGIDAFSSRDTLSGVWSDFINTKGALVPEQNSTDRRKNEKGAHLLQAHCENIRNRLNDVRFEALSGGGVQAAGCRSTMDTICARIKRQGGDVVAAVYMMPRHLRYLDQAVADAKGLIEYLDRTKEDWQTPEEMRLELHELRQGASQADVQQGETMPDPNQQVEGEYQEGQ